MKTYLVLRMDYDEKLDNCEVRLAMKQYRICDVVLNSVWYDPRVRRQTVSYCNDKEILFSCVGLKCQRYDKEKISKLPFENTIVEIDPKYDGKQHSIIKKLIREIKKNSGIYKAILNYNPQLIHANDLNALIPSYLAAKKLHCKLVYDSHEINTENYQKRVFLSKVLRVVEKYITKKVDLMICVSNAAAQYFSDQYKIQKPFVVTNSALKEDIRKRNPQNKQEFIVLNHGQFYSGRGYDIMIDSCRFLQDYPEVKLALRGFGALEEQLKSQKEKVDCNNQVVFYPPVTIQELIPLAMESDVGVAITEPICLNFRLSVSNKLFEYAAAGLPVIMSDIPEHRYLNEKYNFGIVLEKNTPEEFAKAVKLIYLDKELYKILSSNAEKMIRELNWDVQFDQLLKREKKMIEDSEKC